MAAISLQFTIDAKACAGGGHFGADVDFAGQRYRVHPIMRERPTPEEMQRMIETLVAALSYDQPTHADVVNTMPTDPIAIRPELTP